MVLCTYLSVNVALEFSAEGSEGAVLVGKVNIVLLQRGLGGGGPSDGRHWEGMHGNLKLTYMVLHSLRTWWASRGSRNVKLSFSAFESQEGARRVAAFLFPILAHSLKHHLFSAFAVVYTSTCACPRGSWGSAPFGIRRSTYQQQLLDPASQRLDRSSPM